VASIFAPCIIVGEHTRYFLVVNFTSSVLFLLIAIGMPFMVLFVPVPELNSNHTDIFNISIYQNQTLQNLANMTTDEIYTSHPIYGIATALVCLWILNFIFICLLFVYIHPMTRLRISRWINFHVFYQNCFDPIWDSTNQLWLPFITQFLDNPEDLGKINKRIGITLRSTLLEFAVETGQYKLTKALLEKENYPTQNVYLKACKGGHLGILQLLVKFAQRKSVEIGSDGDQKMILVTLQNEVKEKCGILDGGYVISHEDQTNGRNAWINSEVAIWYDSENDKWRIGSKSNIGTSVCGIYSTTDAENPILVGNDWEYLKAAGQWVKVNPGDIIISNIEGKKL
jgi:hypothetical protein